LKTCGSTRKRSLYFTGKRLRFTQKELQTHLLEKTREFSVKNLSNQSDMYIKVDFFLQLPEHGSINYILHSFIYSSTEEKNVSKTSVTKILILILIAQFIGICLCTLH
jgi:hypothetical protein